MCKCSIMSPQNESARLLGALPGGPAPPSRRLSKQVTETGLLVTRPASQGGEGLGRMGSGALSVFPAHVEGAGWGPDAGQVGTFKKVRWRAEVSSLQTLLYSAT